MFNTFLTIGCVIVGIGLLATIIVLCLNIWHERHEWIKQDEQEKADDY